ncbi:MAG: hypothetical protein GY789_21675 [Hyphomicrobiales bacterium]|nr:hypothetical protein [Hyphomicrobiales bacterium]
MKKVTNTQTAAEDDRKLPEFMPAGVLVSTEGFQWRGILVRCPRNMVADDLRSPSIWRRVQTSRQSALCKLDHLTILA